MKILSIILLLRESFGDVLLKFQINFEGIRENLHRKHRIILGNFKGNIRVILKKYWRD